MKPRCIVVLLFFVFLFGACGNGVDEGGIFTEEQKLLIALEGTWVGMTDEAVTFSSDQSVVLNMTLPGDGKPRLEGLAGTIRLGGEIDNTQVDPDIPNYPLSNWYAIRDGFIFDLQEMAIVSNRLIAEFEAMMQWSDFCEAQAIVYDNGGGFYRCIPGGQDWSGDCGPTKGPDGGEGCIYTGPNSEEVIVGQTKIDLCMFVCSCDADGCTVDAETVEHGHNELDIAVDIDDGVMLGTGSLGRLEATKQ